MPGQSLRFTRLDIMWLIGTNQNWANDANPVRTGLCCDRLASVPPGLQRRFYDGHSASDADRVENNC